MIHNLFWNQQYFMPTIYATTSLWENECWGISTFGDQKNTICGGWKNICSLFPMDHIECGS